MTIMIRLLCLNKGFILLEELLKTRFQDSSYKSNFAFLLVVTKFSSSWLQ